MTERRFYGYKHWTLEPVPRCFNVGRGGKGRANDKQGRNAKWKNVAQKYGLRVEICAGPFTDDEANQWEIEHIIIEKTYVGDYPNGIGCNFTCGGEGCTGGKGGKGKPAWNKGKTGVYTQEVLLQQSKRQTGLSNISNRPDVRAKLASKQHLTNAKISASNKKGDAHHTKRTDVKDKIRQAITGRRWVRDSTTNSTRQVPADQAASLVNQGWVYGR